MEHKPVLLNEVIKLLRPDQGRVFIDATIDGGGHAREILKRMGEKAILIGIDRDKKMISRLQKEFAGEARLKLKAGNFRNIGELAGEFAKKCDGILFDLGLSSIQLESSGRGFSFQKDEPLLMTYESDSGPNTLNAAKIVNSLPENELAEILRNYGEEKFAGRIARAIVAARRRERILTTGQLTDIVKTAAGRFYKHQKIHPATRTFQALRLAVNDELGALATGLDQAWDMLVHGGRLTVLSFHSLEDRIVKKFFLEKKPQVGILTKKAVRPSVAEIKDNPRARSARLRSAEKI
ncbi:MAG: 16S rRNA (cytosine(1402)-N(4))-methyltransferase RsmH [Patescibacteria group bacterium]